MHDRPNLDIIPTTYKRQHRITTRHGRTKFDPPLLTRLIFETKSTLHRHHLQFINYTSSNTVYPNFVTLLKPALQLAQLFVKNKVFLIGWWQPSWIRMLKNLHEYDYLENSISWIVWKHRVLAKNAVSHKQSFSDTEACMSTHCVRVFQALKFTNG